MVVFNCRFSVSQMHTWEDIHVRLFQNPDLFGLQIPTEYTINLVLEINVELPPKKFPYWLCSQGMKQID